MLKKLLYGAGGLALLVGLWGLYDRFAFGHQHANYGSYVTWGLWVAMYMFFAGVATGAFMLATLDYLFELPLFKGTGRAALWGAVVTMPAALAAIGLDLGHMSRIWKVYLQPNFGSVMAQLVWGYTIFLVIVAVALWLTFRQPRSVALKVLMASGLFLTIFLSGGGGALLGVNASRTSWHVGNLPAQFPSFSLTSGVALMLIAIGWFGPASDELRPRQLRALGIAMAVLLLVKGYYLWTDVSQALYQGGSHGAEAARVRISVHTATTLPPRRSRSAGRPHGQTPCCFALPKPRVWPARLRRSVYAEHSGCRRPAAPITPAPIAGGAMMRPRVSRPRRHGPRLVARPQTSDLS